MKKQLDGVMQQQKDIEKEMGKEDGEVKKLDKLEEEQDELLSKSGYSSSWSFRKLIFFLPFLELIPPSTPEILQWFFKCLCCYLCSPWYVN